MILYLFEMFYRLEGRMKKVGDEKLTKKAHETGNGQKRV